MKCETRSGPYQCEREAGHDGPCETQAREYDGPRDLANVVDRLITRVLVLEAQVASLQMAAERGIPR